MTAHLALGSNLGDRLANLREARDRLAEFAEATVISAPVYETDPLDCPPDSPSYYNTVLQMETTLSPGELLEKTQAIEAALGRESEATRENNSPRPIDIDLLLCDEIVLETERLTLPHPRLHERLFVLYPFRDIAPALVPVTHANPVSILLEICESSELAPIEICALW